MINELLLGLLIGIGLSAACGLRVFLPLLILSLAARSGWLTLTDNFSWVAADASLTAFAVATILEIAAYHVPWLDNLLDSLTGPAAAMAGVVATAACLGDAHPLLKWSLAVIAGGGTAGLIKALSAAVRATSSLTTGGLGNPLLTVAETSASFGVALLAVFLPAAGGLVLLTAGVLVWRRWRRARESGANQTAAGMAVGISDGA